MDPPTNEPPASFKPPAVDRASLSSEEDQDSGHEVDSLGSEEDHALDLELDKGEGREDVPVEVVVRDNGHLYTLKPGADEDSEEESGEDDDLEAESDDDNNTLEEAVQEDGSPGITVEQDTISTSSNERATAVDGTAQATMDQYMEDLWSQYDASRMQLTEEEHQWALDIKHAIERIPDLDNLSDFRYAQLAILSEGNTAEAVHRAYRLQEFKKENQIKDNVYEGLRCYPREPCLISMDYNLQTGGHVVAFDASKFDASVWSNPESTRTYNRRKFYSTLMTNCDFEKVRAGQIVLLECEGFQLIKGKSIDLRIFRKCFQALHALPTKVTHIKFFNPPAVIRFMVAMAKSALPEDITSRFQIGAKFPAGRLDKFYHLPTPEIARERMQERNKELLLRRYANEAHFRLDELVPEPRRLQYWRIINEGDN